MGVIDLLFFRNGRIPEDYAAIFVHLPVCPIPVPNSGTKSSANPKRTSYTSNLQGGIDLKDGVRKNSQLEKDAQGKCCPVRSIGLR